VSYSAKTQLIQSDHLHLIPRSAPSFALPSPCKPLEVNALGYAGMLLVKSAEELAVLEQATNDSQDSTDAAGLMRILAACGVPRDWAIDTAPQEDGALAS
jgi:ATP adenylyltransferase